MLPSIHQSAKSSRSAGASWSALVATSAGLDDFGRVRVNVQAKVGDLEGGHRLVVQCYPRAVASRMPSAYTRPLAAAQRAVNGDDLLRGVEVVLVNSDFSEDLEGCAVWAWIERGAPDLEFDGLRARPTSAAYVGTCCADDERAQVVLERAAA
jgi:hypothetical protein